MYVVQEDSLAFVRKLGIKQWDSVLLLNAPADFSRGLRDSLPLSFSLYDAIRDSQKPDMVLWWPQDELEVTDRIESLRHHIKEDGAVWIVIPKKPVAKARGVDLSYGPVVEEALKTGLVDNKTLTFSQEEYGIRFVVRVTERNHQEH